MAISAIAASRWDRIGCPVCGGTDVWCFFEWANVPVRDGLLLDSAEEAAAAPTANLRLSVCKTCFYIGNEDYQPDKVRLGGYDFSQAAFWQWPGPKRALARSASCAESPGRAAMTPSPCSRP